MKQGIGCVLPQDLHDEFIRRTYGVSKGKSALIAKALRFYFDAVPFEQAERKEEPVAPQQDGGAS